MTTNIEPAVQMALKAGLRINLSNSNSWGVEEEVQDALGRNLVPVFPSTGAIVLKACGNLRARKVSCNQSLGGKLDGRRRYPRTRTTPTPNTTTTINNIINTICATPTTTATATTSSTHMAPTQSGAFFALPPLFSRLQTLFPVPFLPALLLVGI